MKSIRCVLGTLLLVASLYASPALATSFGTDHSDLWWIPTESGWGMQIVQRGSVIFATLYVYDPAGKPTWYVATMNPTGVTLQWSGSLYATTGPWFGTVPFNPASVTATVVGTMTWTVQDVNDGNVSYTVNGVAVSKNVTRQTLVFDNFAGHYGGGLHEVITGCANPALNGTYEPFGVLNITQTGQNIILQSLPIGFAGCTYNGALTQAGQMGEVSGSFSCADGSGGTFFAFEIQVTDNGLIGRFQATNTSPPGCTSSGWFGGLRVTTF